VVGLALVFAATNEPIARALRAAVVPGALLAAALLLDIIPGPRGRLLLPMVALLTTLSVVFLSRIEMVLATKQIMWVLMGSALLVATYFLIDDVRDLARLKYLAGGSAVALLAITAVWGTEQHGARLWLGIPGAFSFQAGEVAKLLMVIFLAGYIAERVPTSGLGHRRPAARPHAPLTPLYPPACGGIMGGCKYSAPLLIIVILGLALLISQRDLGAAALFFGLFVAMLYLGTGRKDYAVGGIAVFLAGAVAAYYTFPHAAARVQAWLNPWQAPQQSGYQPLQALFCLAEGGIVGTGLGRIPIGALPAAGTDLILAVVGHDIGLLGTLAVVMMYAFFCFRAYDIARGATDRFGALLAAGIATIFALQSLLIIGGVVRLIPLTGITLPFLSYGGTSMIINFIAVGLLMTVVRDCTRPESGRLTLSPSP